VGAHRTGTEFGQQGAHGRPQDAEGGCCQGRAQRATGHNHRGDDLRADEAEGRSWYGEPGKAELVDWEPVLTRAGVHVSAVRVAQAYLELAVLVRALEGLASNVRFGSGVDRSSLWAGLFDLRENLLGQGQDDLRAIAS